MDKIKISTAQFEHKNADKAYNLSIIEKLSRKASTEGSNVIAFHECSITGYTFARHLTKDQMLELAEPIPGGDSVLKLIEIAQNNNIVILAGLFDVKSYDTDHHSCDVDHPLDNGLIFCNYFEELGVQK